MQPPSFNLGKPLLAMLIAALISGIWLIGRRSPPAVDQTVWVFSDSHARTLRDPEVGGGPSLIEQWEQQTGHSLRAELINSNALDVRLLSLINAPPPSGQRQRVPDIVEIEIGSVSEFFRAPANEVGFVPLNHYLQESGYWSPDPAVHPATNPIVAARLAPWTKDGVIFGVPHDLHPVTITYRKDLFDQAGVDLNQARTWQELHALCLQFQEYWAAHGQPRRRAVELPRSSADDLVVMLLQRHLNLLDQQDRVHLADPIVLQTLMFYVTCVADPADAPSQRIAADITPQATWVRDLAAGNTCAVLTPDWKIADLLDFCPRDDRGHFVLEGKLSMIPLPIFQPGDAPTSTWGGTMIGIPKACKDPDAAWKLLQFLYLSPQAMAARRLHTRILPPLRSSWKNPAYHQPPSANSVFAAQKVQGCYVPEELYIKLADRVPERYVTPFTAAATAALSACLTRAVRYAESKGYDGLEAACQSWLQDASEQVEKRIAFGKIN